MFSKVSVLVPTRGRTGMLGTMLDSYARTTVGVERHSELIFRADEDDGGTIEFLSKTPHAYLVGPRGKGYESLPRFFNELASACLGDVVMIGNDDMVFVTEGWATRILAVANRYPDGVFNVGVRTHNEGHFPLSIVSKVVVDRLGFLYDPRIFWGDIYLRDVMARFGRAVMIDDVEIRHDWAGHNPDQTFREGEGARRAGWMAHHEQAVSDAEVRLRELVG